MKNNLWILLLTTLLASAFTIADEPVKRILMQLERYRAEFPQEKVHLHLDKPYYAAGDSIWFKAYVVTAENNKLSGISNILYADLINDMDSVVQSLRLPLALGLGSGSFSLPDTLHAGTYRIRAYTQWMRNFGEDLFFDKTIAIGNITSGDSTIKASPKTALSDPEVRFFPEGGDLIAGISSKVAFKVTGPTGSGIKITGYISNQDKIKVAELRSEHAGMGLFELKPYPGHSYTAHIRFEDGSERSFPLPEVLAGGYSLSADSTHPDTLTVSIAVSPGLLQSGEITLLAQSNGVVKYASKSLVDRSILRAAIPKSRFPTGIVQLTLFSPQQEPVAERLVFIDHGNDLDITVKTEKSSYGKREKVKMILDVKDQDGKPIAGSFSLAVTDESRVPYDEWDEMTIRSNLLLTSDLRGYIEQPNYYFTEVDEQTIRHLDLLMMTQGWRRFEWKNLLAGAFPSLTFKPEKGIEVSGRVTSLLTGKPIKGGKVSLLPLSETELSMLSDTITDADGRFKFENLFFMDSTQFSIQAKNLKDRKNTVIKIDQSPGSPDTKRSVSIVEIKVTNPLHTYLKSSKERSDEFKRFGVRNTSVMLSEVKVIAKKSDVMTQNRARYGSPDRVVQSEQLETCGNLLLCLPGRMGGLVVKGDISQYNAEFYFSRDMRTPVTIIVDGVEIEPRDIAFISSNDIKTVEAYKMQALLLITTKSGELNTSDRFIPGIASYKPKGYYKEREFYSPNYTAPGNTQMRDLRTTIFWAPHVVTDSTGKAVVEFFNADGAGNYRTIVEGISLDGTIGRKIYRYAVK